MRAMISGLFGKSPFGGLARHTEQVHETVELIRPLFTAFLDEDWERTGELNHRISKLEHKADIIKAEIRDHLPKSMFLPVDRGDVLLFLREQDHIADGAEDLGVILSLRRTPAPPGMRDDILQLVDQVIRVSEAWYQTVKDLPKLQEASFVGPEVERTLERVTEISGLEWEADKQQAALARRLFEHEDSLDPVTIFFWMHIFETLGEVANHAENTSDLLRLMLARR